MSRMESDAPKVIISYTHDSPEHKGRVLDLAERLRFEGVDCDIDQYEDSPPEGWPRWMENQIQDADFVLVVCTETYAKRFRGNEAADRGLGAQWEGYVITQDLYDEAARNTRFIPVLFSADARFIPKTLRGATHYRVDLDDGYEDLYRRLTAQPRVKKSPLGSRRVLGSVNDRPELKDENNVQVLHTSREIAQPAITEKKPSNLALIFEADEKFIFLSAERIELGEQLSLELLPSDARAKVYLADLKDRYNQPSVAIAFGDTVVQGRVVKTSSVFANSIERWQIQVKPSNDGFYSSLADFTFNNYTPENIAELKARLILLNEQPKPAGGRDRLRDGHAESMITRADGLLKQVKCPLPSLFEMFGDDPDYFLDSARLMTILYLKLADAVEHTFKLDFQLANDKVAVQFEGQRRARYANVPPYVIKLSGVCPLK
jgi:hypothetical protein